MAKTAGRLTLVFLAGSFPARCGFAVKKTERLPEMIPELIPNSTARGAISLPEPSQAGMSLEEAIENRRSRRDFRDQGLTLGKVSQMLWAAQGVTDASRGFRAAPSAGALYPLEVYLVVKKDGVDGLEPGVYHYQPEGHRLEIQVEEDVYDDFVQACLGQVTIAQAPVSLVIAAAYERTTGKYGEKGGRYVEIEVGHVGQNIYLQAGALGLGTCAIGAYQDEEIIEILNLPENQEPLYVMPLGYPDS